MLPGVAEQHFTSPSAQSNGGCGFSSAVLRRTAMGEKVSAAAAATATSEEKDDERHDEQRDPGGRRVSATSSSSSASSSSSSQTLSEEEGEAASAHGLPQVGPLSCSASERTGEAAAAARTPLTVAVAPPLLLLRGKEEGEETTTEGHRRGVAGQLPPRRRESEEEDDDDDNSAALPGVVANRHFRPPERDASLEEQDEELDSILSPPSMPFRKSSNPEVSSGPGKSLKFKRQLSEEGKPFRRGSLGGALTSRYLLPNGVTHQAWQSGETTNLVRMRSQTLGQSAPSLTASLIFS